MLQMTDAQRDELERLRMKAASPEMVTEAEFSEDDFALELENDQCFYAKREAANVALRQAAADYYTALRQDTDAEDARQCVGNLLKAIARDVGNASGIDEPWVIRARKSK